MINKYFISDIIITIFFFKNNNYGVTKIQTCKYLKIRKLYTIILDTYNFILYNIL